MICALPALLATLSLAPLAAVADDEGPAAAQESGRRTLEDLMGPMLEGSGTWRAPNAEHVAGDPKSAAFWRLEHEWIFPRTLVRYRILGEHEDGGLTTYWEGTVAWDPRAEVARVLQVHAAGIFGWGDVRRIAPDTVRASLTFWHPGGGSESFRDDMRFTGPGTLETHSLGYDATEWKWIEKRVEHWTLVPARDETGAKPGGS